MTQTPRVVHTRADYLAELAEIRQDVNATIGLVMTMGAR